MSDYSRLHAERICNQYGVELDLNRLTGKEATIYDIAKSVLTVPALRLWLVDQEAHSRQLRRELGLWPENMHSATVNRELANL